MLEVIKVNYKLGDFPVDREIYVEGANKDKKLKVSPFKLIDLNTDYEDILGECIQEEYDVSSAIKLSVSKMIEEVENYLDDIRCAQSNLQDEIEFFEYSSQIMSLKELIEEKDLPRFEEVAGRIIEKTNALTDSIAILSEMEEDAEELQVNLLKLSEKLK